MAQTMDEAVVHRVVHDIGYTKAVAFCLYLCNMGLCVLGDNGFGVIAFDRGMTVEYDAATRIFLGKTLCAADGLHAAVGAGSGDIVLQEDATSLDGADERVVDTNVVGSIGRGGERH